MRRLPLYLLVALVAFLVTLALAFAVKAEAYTHSPTLNQTASWLAGRPVTVHCPTRDEALLDPEMITAYAYVVFPDAIHPDNYMTVSPTICAPLLRYLKDGVRNVSEYKLALSILVITHESAHLRGEGDEAKAECWAVRHVRYVALHLGFSEKESWWLRDLALRFDAAHNRKYPEYDLPGCKRPQIGVH